MEEEGHPQAVDQLQKLIEAVPKERNWDGTSLYKYQNFWCPTAVLEAVVSSQKHFEALDTDIILISPPKSGTTWLKSLIFSICNRHVYEVKDSPLMSCGPHELVPSLEFVVYMGNGDSPNITNNNNNNTASSSPRVFATHIPYDSLPPSQASERKRSDAFPVGEAFEMFCQGIHSYGPFWDHVLGYWNASLQAPDKVLFMKYEEMKKEPTIYTKMLAQFIGLPFGDEEEKEGMVDDIVRLCSFEKLKNLEVNKKGQRPSGAPNSAFFRKGDIGDWVNFLKPNEVQQLEKIIEEKLKNSGLSFHMNFYLLGKEANA